jgi:hypothetical protein
VDRKRNKTHTKSKKQLHCKSSHPQKEESNVNPPLSYKIFKSERLINFQIPHRGNFPCKPRPVTNYCTTVKAKTGIYYGVPQIFLPA